MKFFLRHRHNRIAAAERRAAEAARIAENVGAQWAEVHELSDRAPSPDDLTRLLKLSLRGTA